MEPVKLRLIKKERFDATLGEEGLPEMAAQLGSILVYCSGPQAFAEIVTRFLHSHLAVAAVQQAIHCLQMAKSPADRIDDMRMLQDVHHKLTGWHFDSAATPAPIEGVKPSSGSVSMDVARKMWGDGEFDKLHRQRYPLWKLGPAGMEVVPEDDLPPQE